MYLIRKMGLLSRNNNSEISPEEVREFYKIAVELHSSESQRYWDRNTVFIVVNGGLLALLSVDFAKGNRDRIAVCMLGLIVSYVWWLILRQGKDLIERWSLVARSIEDEHNLPIKLYRIADHVSSEGISDHSLPFSTLPASSLMRLSAVVVMIGWIAAIATLWFSN